MRLRTFQAHSMNEAMEAIRAQMGEDAVILSTKNVPGGRGVVVTVGIDEEAEDDRIVPMNGHNFEPAPERHFVADPVFAVQTPNQRMPANRPDIDNARGQQLRELETVLRYHATPQAILEKLLETARFLPLPPGLNFGGVKKALAQVMDVFFQFAPLMLEDNHRIMFVGPSGAGKTTAVAKIAARLKMEQRRFHVITTDNTRAGGIEQLQMLTTILGVPLHVAVTKDELKTLIQKLPATDCTLIDSAGANPYEGRELKELAELLNIGSIEPVLVLPAGMDAAEAEFTAKAFQIIHGIKHLMITRTDAARRYGSLMAAAHALGAAFCHASGSPKISGDFVTLNAEVLSSMLMQYRLTQSDRAQSNG